MKIATKVVIRIDTGEVLEWEGFDYEGPVALCGRAEAKATNQQALSTSSQDQQNAQAAVAGANQSVADYNNRLNSFMRFGRRTFGPNGEFMRTQNALANTTAAAGARALGGDLALHSARTGENTAGYATAAAEDRRQRQRDLTTQLATADATRLGQLTEINKTALDASKYPGDLYARLYGVGTEGAVGALNPAERAATGSKGFGQTLGDAFAETLGENLAGGKKRG